MPLTMRLINDKPIVTNLPIKTHYYIGIDPGENGGIAILRNQDTEVFELLKMPETDYDMYFSLYHYNTISHTGVTTASDRVEVVIEQQIPRPTAFYDKATKTWRQSILKSTCLLYGNYCKLRMATMAAGLPTEECPPKRWQDALKIPAKAKSETPTQWKNRLKAKAQQLYPTTKITLATADALLIATYCMRKHTGTL